MEDEPERHPERRPNDAVLEPLPGAIDADTFIPRLLALLSNALVWRESSELRRRFQLGTNDWRVISALAIRPGMSATDVSEFVAMNKAIISKSANTLAARSLIVFIDGPRGSRPMYLTPQGAAMYRAMLPISMHGQEIILTGFTAEEISQLNTLLIRMLRNRAALQSPPPTACRSADD